MEPSLTVETSVSRRPSDLVLAHQLLVTILVVLVTLIVAVVAVTHRIEVGVITTTIAVVVTTTADTKIVAATTIDVVAIAGMTEDTIDMIGSRFDLFFSLTPLCFLFMFSCSLTFSSPLCLYVVHISTDVNDTMSVIVMTVTAIEHVPGIVLEANESH